MAVYEFAVLSLDQTVLTHSLIELESCDAAWAQVASLAWKLGEMSGLIRVTDSEGELVILTGVASARRASPRGPSAPLRV